MKAPKTPKADKKLLEACKYVQSYFTESPSRLWPDLKMGKSKMSDLIEDAIKGADNG